MSESSSEIIIREMKFEEEEEVRNLFKTQLWLFDRLIFLMVLGSMIKLMKEKKGTVLVALLNNKIVGTMSLKHLEISGIKKGLIDAVATNKDIRGKGIGKKLLAGSVSWLEKNGVNDIYATVDRYNSRSWNMFLHSGFSPYELKSQRKDLGLGFLKLWAKEGYFFSMTTFFVKKDVGNQKPKESSSFTHFLIAGIILTISWSIMLFRWQINWNLFPLLLTINFLGIIIHELSHKLVAKAYGKQTEFKSWKSGLIFNFFISLIGGIYPAYGSTYIKQKDWSYAKEENKKKNGIIYLIGPIACLLLSLLFLYLGSITPDINLKRIWRFGYIINILTFLFNLLPFRGAGGFAWDGGKIFDWNKIVWILLFVSLIVVMVLFPL